MTLEISEYFHYGETHIVIQCLGYFIYLSLQCYWYKWRKKNLSTNFQASYCLFWMLGNIKFVLLQVPTVRLPVIYPRCCHSVLTSCTHKMVVFMSLYSKSKKGVFLSLYSKLKKGVFFSGPWGPCLQFSVFDSDVNWKLTKQKYSRLDSIRIRLTIDDGWRAPVFLTES